ncbi:HdeD family acid-resistance protein [Neorhizobium alkalisoli]|uniref:Uncharacterized membrane protein HdeD (DUF308 family) n=1 Tax=Neorhizobium alkalisoli TaxID=528178 RepID=A0A561R8M2_9HYPH|nr:hypothetical protein [Neorhizobium alkalisoli]TWF58971.1 uncharacterized membrane protein HdeD (DUF308 family) [Neorhizobium alkalisoli]
MARTTRPASYPQQTTLLKERQGNILVTGILVTAAGMTFFCNIVAVAGVSWQVIGLMLLTTGLLQFHASWQIRERVPSVMWGTTVALYAAFGVLAFINPSTRIAALSLAFFAGLIATGTMRCCCGYVLQAAGRGWRWLVTGGGFTIAMGSLLMAGWPYNDLATAGRLLALDLTAYGLSLVGFALYLGSDVTKGRAKKRLR